jgi:hypothetical protein
MAGPKIVRTSANNPAYGYGVPTQGQPLEGVGRVRMPGEGGDEFPWGVEGIRDRAMRMRTGAMLNAMMDTMASQETGAPPPTGIAGMLAEAYKGGIPAAAGPVISSPPGKIAMTPVHRGQHPEIGLLDILLGGYGEGQ